MTPERPSTELLEYRVSQLEQRLERIERWASEHLPKHLVDTFVQKTTFEPYSRLTWTIAAAVVMGLVAAFFSLMRGSTPLGP
jgi:hypothetical protein